MKKIYAVTAGAFVLFGIHASAQCTLNISATSDTVCAGQSTTLTANATGPGSALTTTFAAGNNHRGNMFDVTAVNTVTITSFDAHPMSNTTIEIYYKSGTWVGFENSPASWTLVGSASVTAQPTGNPTPVPVAVNVTIPAGQTYAFYVTSTNTAVSLNYTDGTTVGNVYASDANIQFKEGAGLEYPFTNGTGSTFTPRIWNGIIHYSMPSGTPSYLWNTTATTQSISPVVSSTTTYSVDVTVPGCPSTLSASVAIVANQLPVVLAGNDTTLCGSNTITLSGAGASTYSWTGGVLDGVPFSASSSNSYTVTGTDVNGCSNTDSVTVTVNSLPLVSAGNDTTVCAESMLTLAGTGASVYIWSGGVSDGVAFLVTGSNTYTVTGTDVNGCTASDMINVTAHMVNTGVTVLNETITADDSTATYQWIDCASTQPIAGETSQSFTATVNGSYAVIVTDSMCSDTSACQAIISTGISAMSALPYVTVNPNPTTGVFELNTGAAAVQITITDVTGRLVTTIIPQGQMTAISLENEPAGIDFANVVTTDNSVTTVKVVKQ